MRKKSDPRAGRARTNSPQRRRRRVARGRTPASPSGPANHGREAIQPQTDWAELVPALEWQVYQRGIQALRTAGIRFMVGGAFALACYTGRWRNTKDIDFYILPEDRERGVAALLDAGFSDYATTRPYDRRWIYRATRSGCIVDLIWAMANQRAQVAGNWFEHAVPARLRGEPLSVLPAEELFWCKLYIVQRDRCDWPDLINILHQAGPELDWDRLFARVGEDRALLLAVLALFGWVSPKGFAALPVSVRKRLPELPATSGAKDGAVEGSRVAFLDSRPWFAAYQPKDRPLPL